MRALLFGASLAVIVSKATDLPTPRNITQQIQENVPIRSAFKQKFVTAEEWDRWRRQSLPVLGIDSFATSRSILEDAKRSLDSMEDARRSLYEDTRRVPDDARPSLFSDVLRD